MQRPIPVFIDWNIGNFSVTRELQFFLVGTTIGSA